MGSDFSKQREEIKKSSCPINILVIGEQYEGKSSLINTLYYAANDERLPIAEVAPTGLTANRWTTKFRKHRITSTINAFDVPGMNFRTDVQLFLLEKLLLGANTNQNIPLEEDTLQNLLKESKLSENVENRIDFILWVVDATKLESNSGKFLLWKWAQLSLQTRAYYEKLFTFVRNKSELGKLKELSAYIEVYILIWSTPKKTRLIFLKSSSFRKLSLSLTMETSG